MKPISMSRWNQVVLVLLCCVLWCSHAALAVDDCSPQGPENCTFETNVDLASGTSDFTWCSWVWKNWVDISYTAFPWIRYIGLSWTTVTGSLTSRMSCSTQGQELCFFFRYRFDVADEIDLNVYIQNITQDKVWSANSAGFLGVFQQAYIPISTQYDYAVVFNATRRLPPSPSNQNTVYLDDLQFVQSPCPRCFTEGPENCTFQIDYRVNVSTFTSCSWTSSGGWSTSYAASAPWQRYPGLAEDKSYGTLTSRPACSTNGQTHCLMFDYKFTSPRDTVKLTVFIEDSQIADRKVIVWSEQRDPKYNFWERASVPVNTSYDCVVIFEATRLSDETLNINDMTVYIDNIAYTSIPCSSVMSTTATPTTSTPPTTTKFTPQTTTIFTPQTTTTFTPQTTNTFTPQTTNTTTPPTTTTYSSTSADTAAQTIPETTSNVPLIAGLAVSVAVIVILTVSVIAILVLRRHRRQDSSTARPQAEYVFQNPAANAHPDYDDIAEKPQDRHRASASRTYPSGLPQANSDYDDIVEDHYDYLKFPPAVPEANSSGAESANRDATVIPRRNETACPPQNSVFFASEIYSGLAGRHARNNHRYDYSRFGPNAHQNEERPYANQKLPYSNKEFPYANEQNPNGNKKRPYANEKLPNANKERPYANEKLPNANKERPYANEKLPNANKERPYANEELPNSNNERPYANEENQNANNEHPTANKELPTANKERPYANEKLPTANKERPYANEKLPNANKERPYANEVLPHANKERPYANENLPNAN